MSNTAPAFIRLSEVLGALSYALDLTEGQPRGHCLRACWIGVHVGRELGLDDHDLWELYYTVLLKDAGCSSNAARLCQLYLSDDLSLKRDFKLVGDKLPHLLGFVLSHTGLGAPLAERFRAVLNIVRNGGSLADELIESRCQRGADIARKLRFPEPVAGAIAALDEHWNGRGRPLGLEAELIPLYARIALLAQLADVFHASGGRPVAVREVRRRAGTWFDPRVFEAFQRVAERPAFWEGLRSDNLEAAVLALEPAQHACAVDDDYLDDIAAAFAQIVDSKTPFTRGHSERVAVFADLIAEQLGLDTRRRRRLRRAALLHDIGKLGVSNCVLDKPGKLDPHEWAAIRRHPVMSEEILSRIGVFRSLAVIGGQHHERLDGKGYPRGLGGSDLGLETRIVSVADVFDALTADRPYRAALPIAAAFDIMAAEVGKALDPDCFRALRGGMERLEQAA